jgi:hypothetical protein
MCLNFYRWSHDGIPRRSPLHSVECARPCFGDDPIYAFHDTRLGSHDIACGVCRAGTGFVAPATALAFDGGPPAQVWIAGDFRVRAFAFRFAFALAFAFDGLREADLLYVGNPEAPEDAVVARAALAVWGDVVVLGHGRCLTAWNRLAQSPEVPGWSWSSGWGSSASGINRRRGRARAGTAQVPITGDIDCLAAVGEFLAIASADAPTVHIARRSGSGRGSGSGSRGSGEFAVEIVCRLIGHTAGITALVPHTDGVEQRILSGSVDGSVKLWNLDRRQIVLTLVRAEGNYTVAVTALHVAECPGMDHERCVFVFAGHSDAVLDVWDLSRKCPVIKIAVEKMEQSRREELVPIALRFNVLPHTETAELIILGLERPDSGSSDGEVIAFKFPFGREGE